MEQGGLEIVLLARGAREHALYAGPATAVLEDVNAVGTGNQALEHLSRDFIKGRRPSGGCPEEAGLFPGRQTPRLGAEAPGREALGRQAIHIDQDPSHLSAVSEHLAVDEFRRSPSIEHDHARVVRGALEDLSISEVDDLLQ